MWYSKAKFVKIAQNLSSDVPKQLTRRDIMNQQLTGSKGTNPGGWFMGNDNQERYVKLYDDPTQANVEHLANQLYRGVGVSAPNSHLLQDGEGVLFATDKIPGDIVGESPTKEQAQNLLRGFAADVLLANWDVVGLSGDNVVAEAPTNNVQRIDNGGALLMRGMGERKPKHLLMSDSEWETFSGHGPVESTYTSFFQAAGINRPEEMAGEIIGQIDDILKFQIKNGGWFNFVRTHSAGLSPGDIKQIVQMLDFRTQKLVERKSKLMAWVGK